MRHMGPPESLKAASFSYQQEVKTVHVLDVGQFH